MSDFDQMEALGPKWYVVHTFSGYENKVKLNLEKIVENRGLQDKIFDIRIPVEKRIIENGDERIEKEVKLFPSYVYIKMVMNDMTWHVVRNIIGVTGFVGPGSRPTQLPKEEVESVLKVKEAEVELAFKVGDLVTILQEGMFKGNRGIVTRVGDMKKITVEIQEGMLKGNNFEFNSASLKLVKQ